MIGIAQLIAPLALSLTPQPPAAPPAEPAEQQLTPVSEEQIAPSSQVKGWIAFEAWLETPTYNQARIEQRVVIRVSPRRPNDRNELTALRQQQSTRLVERRIGNCVPLRGIAGVQTGRNNQLLFYMRDRRVVRADLERACRARDFYSGFYVESSEDGQLCIDRDALQSRTGANCEISRLRQLVAVRN